MMRDLRVLDLHRVDATKVYGWISRATLTFCLKSQTALTTNSR